MLQPCCSCIGATASQGPCLPPCLAHSLACCCVHMHFCRGSYTKDQNLADATRLGEMLASLNRLPFPTVALVQVRACVCKGEEGPGGSMPVLFPPVSPGLACRLHGWLCCRLLLGLLARTYGICPSTLGSMMYAAYALKLTVSLCGCRW